MLYKGVFCIFVSKASYKNKDRFIIPNITNFNHEKQNVRNSKAKV